MFNRPVIWPYRLYSESGTALAGALCTKRVRPNGRYYPRKGDLVVNWGCPNLPTWWGHRAADQTLNLPQFVRNASNKYATFDILQRAGDPVVPFTNDPEEARRWFQTPLYGRKLNAVLCRTLTRANSGRGIVLAKTPEEVVPAPLYTRYKPKSHEYRVHVMHDTVIDAQEKRRVNGFTETNGANPYIRNHPNGWVFCRENLELPEDVEIASIEAVAHLNLHFGAVDIGYHPEFGVSIYEINTAPGIEGQTLVNYANQIRRHLYV